VSNSNRPSPIYFPHLDVTRFIAAFMIVMLHAYEAWVGWFGQIGVLSTGDYKTLSPAGMYADRFVRNMGIGVDLFFLLSGFLITYLLLEEKKAMGRIDLKNFYIRRVLRIWPLYFLIIALTPLLLRWIDSPAPGDLYWPNLLFWNNFHAIQSHDWTYPFAHYWSVCIEEHFYLVWPFVIMLVPRKHLFNTFVALIAASIAFRAWVYYASPEPFFPLFLHTLSRFDVLVLGAVAAIFYSEKPFTFRLGTPVRIILWALLVFVLCADNMYDWSTAFYAVFKKYFYLGIIGVLLLDHNFNPQFPHLLRPKSFIHYLGKVSYGIYMYGNLLYPIIIKKLMWRWQSHNMYLFFSLVIFFSILIPILSYEFIEKPFLKLKNRFSILKTER
jgi:peptidoglycan/LPS O-acetylase OafA/YrhL